MRLTISNLSKTYSNGVCALDKVDLDIAPGMFGLLGPNGAGKSSLMRTIATLQEADSGSISLGDIDVLAQKKKVRELLGYLPQEFGVYPKISAEELLAHFAVLKGLSDRAERKRTVEALLELTNLSAHRKKALGTFSGGMKQRFGIAQALLGSPKLLIVDEPTAGLDPEERVRFHNVLAEVGEDRIVILSTHIVSDVEDLCSEMAVLHEGRVQLKTTPDQAVAGVRGKVWEKVVDRHTKDEELGLPVISRRLKAGQTLIRVWSETAPSEGFQRAEADLEDVYFAVIRGCWRPLETSGSAHVAA